MFDTKADKRFDLGAMQTKEERAVFGCEALSVGTDGIVYICGLVEVKNKNSATGKIGNKLTALQLIIYKPEELK